MMQGSCAQHDLEGGKGGKSARHAKHTHSHAITTFALTSHGLLGDMRHRAGDSSLLGNTRAVYTRTLPTQHTDGTVKGWEVRWWELSLSFIYETQK